MYWRKHSEQHGEEKINLPFKKCSTILLALFLTLDGSWPAGHCKHTHASPHRHCTTAVPPQPITWKMHKSEWGEAQTYLHILRHMKVMNYTARRTRVEQQRWFLIFFNVFFYVHMICSRANKVDINVPFWKLKYYTKRKNNDMTP